MFTEFSASSNQNSSSVCSGCSVSILPAIIAAFMPPIDVPPAISIFILLFASALKTPHPNAPDPHLEVEEHFQFYFHIRS